MLFSCEHEGALDLTNNFHFGLRLKGKRFFTVFVIVMLLSMAFIGLWNFPATVKADGTTTLGYADIGGSSDGTYADNVIRTDFVLASGDTSNTVYLYVGVAGWGCKVGVYDATHNLIASNNTGIAVAETSWNRFNIGNLTLGAGTYGIAYLMSASVGGACVYYTTADFADQSHYGGQLYGSGMPDPWSAGSANQIKYSMFMNYTTTEEEEPPPPPPPGNTYYINATSGEPTDLQNAVNWADGNTTGEYTASYVRVPYGTYVFNPSGTGVTIPDPVKNMTIDLNGATLNNTVNSGTSSFFGSAGFTGNPTQSLGLRITNGTLRGFINTEATTQNVGIGIARTKNVRIDHITFEDFCSAAISTSDTTGGTYNFTNSIVVDQCIFNNTRAYNAGKISYNGYGVAANGRDVYDYYIWESLSDLVGTFNEVTNTQVYVENCTFVYMRHDISCNSGAWMVARYNVCINATDAELDIHGPQYGTGGRGIELYNNTLSGMNGYGINLRGGSNFVANNTLTDYAYNHQFWDEGKILEYLDPERWCNFTFIWDETTDGGVFLQIRDSPWLNEEDEYFLHAPNATHQLGTWNGADYSQLPYPFPFETYGINNEDYSGVGEATTYTLTVLESVGSGTIDPDVGEHEYTENSNITITWTPSAGYSRVNLEIDGANVTSTSPYVLNMTEDFTVKAYFSDLTAPSFGAISGNTTIAGADVAYSCTISDGVAVSGFIASWNNSGVWVNGTWTAGGSGSLVGTHNATVGNIISVRFYANDSSDNWAVSDISNFTLTDGTEPQFSSHTSSATGSGASCNFGVTVTDNGGLATTGGYIFSTNNTGVWVNNTWVAFSSNPQTISASKTLNSTVGVVVQWRWYANDTADNWATSAIQSLTTTDVSVPTFSSYSSSTTVVNAPCRFNVTVTDNNGLSFYIFSTNNTGSWVNNTAVAFSGNPQILSVLITLTDDRNGIIVGWQIYANDTADNWAAGTIQSLTTTYIYITLQARDAASANLPRSVIFSGSYSNTTTFSVTSSTSGLYELPAIYGSLIVTATWQSNIVKASTNITTTANATENLDTLIVRLDQASNYALISLNSTTLPTPTLEGESNILLQDVAASGSLNIVYDHANWKTLTQPTKFEAGSRQYNTGDGTWTWGSSIFSLTDTYSGTQSLLLTFTVSGGGGGGGGGGGPSSSTIALTITALNLGTVLPNQTLAVYLTLSATGGTITIRSVTFSDAFTSWLTLDNFVFVTVPAGGQQQLRLILNVPSEVTAGEYSGTITVEGIDYLGTTYRASNEVTAIVDGAGANLPSGVLDGVKSALSNPYILAGIITAVLAICGAIVVFTRRR